MSNTICPICGDKNYELTRNGICPSCEVHLIAFVQEKMKKAQQYKDAASHADLPEDALREWKNCNKVYQEILEQYRSTGIDPFSVLDSTLSLRSVQDECLWKISYYEKMVANSVKTPYSESSPNSQFLFCPYCGKSINSKSKFCSECGKKIQNFTDSDSDISREANLAFSSMDKFDEPLAQPNCTVSYDKSSKKKLGCATISLILFCCIIILSLIFIGKSNAGNVSPSGNPEINQSQQASSPPNSTVSKPYHPLYERAYQNANIAIKGYLANPKSAYFKHDYNKFHVSIGKFYNGGTVTYTNSSGSEVTEPFETCIIISDEAVYPLYIKLGNNILVDDSDIVNNLGVVTDVGASRYSNLKQGSTIYKGEIIADWDEEKMKMNYSEYSQISNGMDYAQVTEIVGSYGTELSRVSMLGYETVILAWDGIGSVGANANVTFQNGKVIAKAQIGLQ